MQDINPYAAPRAAVADPGSSSGRPGWVWAILIFYCLGAVGTIVSYLGVFTGAIDLPEDQRQYFAKLGFIDYALSILIVGTKLVASVQLFRLRRQSLYLFPSALVLGLLSTGWHAASKGWVTAVGSSGLASTLFGWGISIAVCVYTWRLAKAGVLK